MKPKKKAKKKPQDATMRNVRAANKKFKQIDQHLKAITLDLMDVFKRIDRLEYLKSIGR